MPSHYPRVNIEFCTKCRWNLRAAWYAQELLSTFGGDLGEVAMAPGDSGVFRVYIQASSSSEEKLIWDRKEQGFPDSKDLKQLVRDVIDPNRNLGHSDKKTNSTEVEKQQERDSGECKSCTQ